MDMDAALLYGFFALIILVLLTVLFLLIHAGLFVSVEVKTCKPKMGQIKVAYKFAKGPYKESGALFTEAHSLLLQYRTVGVYYDDPEKNEPNRLRYIVGLIVCENDQTLNEDDEKLLLEKGYKFATFPAINFAIQAEFPFQSTLSIIMAIYKVYPALRTYVDEHKLSAHPFMEVYDNEEKRIIFIGPLERQDGFYVPEVKSYLRDDDDRSSVSWDDSASILRNDSVEVDGSDSVCDDSVSLLSQSSLPHDSANDSQQKQETQCHGELGVNANVDIKEEDSDNTSSSFEEIDEKEANLQSKKVTQRTSTEEEASARASVEAGER